MGEAGNDIPLFEIHGQVRVWLDDTGCSCLMLD